MSDDVSVIEPGPHGVAVWPDGRCLKLFEGASLASALMHTVARRSARERTSTMYSCTAGNRLGPCRCGQSTSCGTGGFVRRENMKYPAQPATIVGQLVEEYDVSVEMCPMQVDDFLKKLRERGTGRR